MRRNKRIIGEELGGEESLLCLLYLGCVFYSVCGFISPRAEIYSENINNHCHNERILQNSDSLSAISITRG